MSFSPMCRLLIVLAILLAAPFASAQETLPLRWDVEGIASETWHLEVEALEALSDTFVRVHVRTDGDRSRTLLDEGPLSFAVDEPRRFELSSLEEAGRVEITIEGRVEGRSGQVTGSFEYSPSTDLRLQVRDEEWTSDAPALDVRAEGAVQVELLVKAAGNEVLHRDVIEAQPAEMTTHRFAWEPHDTSVMLIEVRATGADGATAWERFIPWQFEVQLQDVQFETGSAEIPSDQEHEIEGVLDEIREAWESVREWIDVELYVAGYTDTVGSAESNRDLSHARATALANWLREHDLEIPIRVQGFGQDVLAVPTDDGVDEPANRRALFVLSDGPPTGSDFPRDRWRLVSAP